MCARPSLAFVIAFTSTMTLLATASAQPAAESDPQAAIADLLQERRDVLAKRVGVMERRVDAGVATMDTLLTAREELLEAELELATSNEQKVALHQQRLKTLQDLEQALTRKHDAGQCELDEVLLAKAARLQAEIALLREQM